MKLPCPLCGESIVYQAEKAGSTIPCTYCKRPLRMPAPDELDPDSRREYVLERKREQERQARQKQKEQAQRQQEQEAKRQAELRERQDAEWKRLAAMQVAEAKREAEERHRREEAEEGEKNKRQERAAQVEGVQDPSPEGPAPSEAYPAMRTIAACFRFAMVISALLAMVAFIVGADMGSKAESAVPFVLGCVATAAFLFQALISWAVAESILMALDSSHDLRTIRYLLKRLPPRVDSTAGES